MQLKYSDPSLLAAALPESVMPADLEAFWHQTARPLAQRLYTQTGITTRVPFVLDDQANPIRLDADLSEILRKLSGQVLGRTTMSSYGRRAFNFIDAAHHDGLTLATVTPAYLADHKRRRHMPPKPGAKAIEPQSWNPEAAAIAALFDVVILMGVRQDNPCNHPSLAWTNVGAAVEPDEPKFITLQQFTKFRDEGLMHARARHPLRNAAFSNMLITSGMRLYEGNGFPALALPTKPERTRGRAFSYEVPAEDAKGHRRRKVPIAVNAYQSMAMYRTHERSGQIKRWGLTDDVAGFWLNQSGEPISEAGWEAIFRDASARSGVDVTPHTLRHTFAVYMLSALLRRSMRSAAEVADEAKRLTEGDRRDVYSSIFGDPLRKLQKLLGHKHYETTFIYLDVLSADDSVIDEALAIFDSAFGSEEDYGIWG